MKQWIKIGLIALVVLVVYQMYFRYDVRQMGGAYYLVVDRLTGQSYNFTAGEFGLFPYPHETK